MTYFLLVNGEYYSEGTYSEMKKEGLKFAKAASKGCSLQDECFEEITSIEVCMFNVTLYDKNS